MSIVIDIEKITEILEYYCSSWRIQNNQVARIKLLIRRMKNYVYFKIYSSRNVENTRDLYESAWLSEHNKIENWFKRDRKPPTLHIFRKKTFECSGGLTQRVWQFYLLSLVEVLKPASVLEVGSGNGINLNLLSRVLSGVSCEGIELTENGVAVSEELSKRRFAKDFSEGLPKCFAERIRELPYDQPRFVQGNALALPYPDAAFGLVYSVLALEQMNDIKLDVIKEMVRVSGKHVLLIEPFQDANTSPLARYLHHRGNEYFNLRIDQLQKLGLKVIRYWADHPEKFSLGVMVVLAEKSGA